MMASNALPKTLKSFIHGAQRAQHAQLVARYTQHVGVTRRLSLHVAASLSSSAPPRIGIVGSGPAGFYTAQYIIKVLNVLLYLIAGSERIVPGTL